MISALQIISEELVYEINRRKIKQEFRNSREVKVKVKRNRKIEIKEK